MKKNTISYLLFLFLILAGYNSVYAVPAIPYPVTVTQPDGSALQIYLKGDEFFHYETTLDGYLLKTNDKGFFVYAQLDEEKNIIPTAIRASNIENRTKKEIESLKIHQPFPDLTAINTQRRAQHAAMLSPEDTEVIQRFPLNGSPKSLVILVNFSDKSFTVSNPKTAFTNLLNQEGYSENGGTGSARDYFISSSMGKFAPQFDVVGPYTLPGTLDSYGRNVSGGDVGTNLRQMVVDACNLANNNGVNLSEYDTDSDGYVDNIFIFYAGYNEAEGGPANTVWPHRWTASSSKSSAPIIGGVRIYDYACTSELRGASGSTMCGIGTFTHEFGHVLGLPDFYATNGASHHTLSYWSVMDAGPYSNSGRTPPAYSAYERFYLGWINPVEIKTPGRMTLDTLTTSNTAYIITQNGDHNLNGGSPTPTEFFMLENRQQKGWDTYLPGHGMLITRINYSSSTWNNNSVNNTASSMGVDIIEADGLATAASLAGDPFPGTSNVKTYEPTLRSGTKISSKPIKQIEETNGIISFSYMNWEIQINVDENIQLFETSHGTPSAVQTITLSGSNLGSDVYIDLSQLNSHFEIRKESDSEWKRSLTITPVGAAISNQKIHIRYNPSEPSHGSVHRDEIKITATSVESKNISLEGKSARPIYVVPPVALAAKDVTSNSFTATWNPVDDATCYYLTVYEQSTGESYIVKDLSVQDVTHTLNNLSGKKYYYKVKASDKMLNGGLLLYENITGFSNEITVELPESSSKKLNVVTNQDGSLTVSRTSVKEPLYVYNPIGVLIRTFDSNETSITIDDLPRSQIYILKSGNRLAKIFLK